MADHRRKEITCYDITGRRWRESRIPDRLCSAYFNFQRSASAGMRFRLTTHLAALFGERRQSDF